MKNFFTRLLNSFPLRGKDKGRGQTETELRAQLEKEKAKLDLRGPGLSHDEWASWAASNINRWKEAGKKMDAIEGELNIIEANKIINP